MNLFFAAVLTVFVAAKHHPYHNPAGFVQSMEKKRSFGHAWIMLEGEGYSFYGSHSGELGTIQPRYFDGIMGLSENGDPNPARYFWAVQSDGFMQVGSGGHKPTLIRTVKLDSDQFEQAREFIEAYDFTRYALLQSQCCTFVKGVLGAAGYQVNPYEEIKLPKKMKGVQLWTDPTYSHFSLATPEKLMRACYYLNRS